MAMALSQLVKAYGDRVKVQVDEVGRSECGHFRDEIVKGWPVDTGASRAGWQGPTKVGHAHYRLHNNYDYAPTIEYGGYPGVGPKTERVGAHTLPGGIQINQGIYPSQRPAAPVRRGISKRTMPLNNALIKILRAT